jgi:hypothetical protein
MHFTPVQDQAIAARMALIVGSATFDRLFAGVRFDEVDGDILYAYAKGIVRAGAIIFDGCRWGHTSASGSHHQTIPATFVPRGTVLIERLFQ